MAHSADNVAVGAARQVSALPAPNLTNSLHPIIPCTQPGDPTHLAHQLATHLIDAALPLYHSILSTAEPDSRPVTVPAFTSSGQQTIARKYPEPLRLLTDAQRDKTHQQLREIAPGFFQRESDTGGAWGETFVDRDRPQLENLPGFGSLIGLSPKILNDLDIAAQRGDTMLLLDKSVDLAETIVHELAHAVSYAVTSHTEREIDFEGCGNGFLGNADCVEIGFEFQRRLFGGIISKKIGTGDLIYQGLRSTLDTRPTLDEWPNARILENYSDAVVGGVRQGVKIPQKVTWDIEWADIARLFREDFWENWYGREQRSLEALHFPKVTRIS